MYPNIKGLVFRNLLVKKYKFYKLLLSNVLFYGLEQGLVCILSAWLEQGFICILVSCSSTVHFLVI